MGDQQDQADPADLAEQQTPVLAADDENEEVVDQSDPEVDEADRLEQARPVDGDDEEYPEG